MDLPKRDGLYVFTYPVGRPSSYTSVLYQTEPMVRVFWYSDDMFTIIHWGREFHYPIINYSTYSDGEDGSGKQMIYIYPPHIGDTLEVFLRKVILEGTISDTITLRNSLQRTNLPGVVRSTNFIANVDGTFPLVYIFDDGRGIMKMFNADSGTFIRDVGSVNYENGRIQLNDIQNSTEFNLSARTRSNTVLAIGSTLLTTRVGDIEILTS